MKGYLKANEVVYRMHNGDIPRYTGNDLEVKFSDGQRGDSGTIRDLIKNKVIQRPPYAHEELRRE